MTELINLLLDLVIELAYAVAHYIVNVSGRFNKPAREGQNRYSECASGQVYDFQGRY